MTGSATNKKVANSAYCFGFSPVRGTEISSSTVGGLSDPSMVVVILAEPSVSVSSWETVDTSKRSNLLESIETKLVGTTGERGQASKHGVVAVGPRARVKS